MPDLAPTPANVHPYDNASLVKRQVGEALQPGDGYYIKSDGKVYKADNNVGDEEAELAGIAVTYAPAVDDYVYGVEGGDLDIGATLVVGETYVVSSNGGKFFPIGDLLTGHRVTYAFYAKDASTAATEIRKATGVQHA